MADTFKVLYQGQPSTSAATVYTSPSATQVVIKNIRIVNTSATATTIKLFQGGTADSNVILPAVSIDAGGFAEFEGAITMAASTTIAAQAGANSSITLTIYGLEVT
jgi:hypothetical protein